MFIIVSYDIKNDKRRTKIHKVLKNYGQWVQYSVFECDIEKKYYLKLRNELDKKIVKEENDSVRFYFLCDTCEGKIERIGGTQPLEDVILI
jgi:CRISPR-associated protein Cas2